jgi:hypothetical protein
MASVPPLASLLSLPNEVLSMILIGLPVPDIGRSARAAGKLRQAVNAPDFWRVWLSHNGILALGQFHPALEAYRALPGSDGVEWKRLVADYLFVSRYVKQWEPEFRAVALCDLRMVPRPAYDPAELQELRPSSLANMSEVLLLQISRPLFGSAEARFSADDGTEEYLFLLKDGSLEYKYEYRRNANSYDYHCIEKHQARGTDFHHFMADALLGMHVALTAEDWRTARVLLPEHVCRQDWQLMLLNLLDHAARSRETYSREAIDLFVRKVKSHLAMQRPRWLSLTWRGRTEKVLVPGPDHHAVENLIAECNHIFEPEKHGFEPFDCGSFQPDIDFMDTANFKDGDRFTLETDRKAP